ncbi:MAG: hypothetical protein RLZZ292_159 [Bacteroidota bacterium]|jgi:hypothetical protein
MRKLLFGLSLWLVLLGILQCKQDEIQGFKLPYQQNFTIGAGIDVFATHIFVLKDINTRLNTLAANNIDQDKIKLLAQAMRLSATFGDVEYGFINDISVLAVNPDDNKKVQEIFYRQDVRQTTGTTLDLIPNSSIDLKPFIRNDKITLRVEIKLWTSPQKVADSRLDFTFVASPL